MTATFIHDLLLLQAMQEETRLLSEAELIAHGAKAFGPPRVEHLYAMSEEIANLKAQLSVFQEAN